MQRISIKSPFHCKCVFGDKIKCRKQIALTVDKTMTNGRHNEFLHFKAVIGHKTRQKLFTLSLNMMDANNFSYFLVRLTF